MAKEELDKLVRVHEGVAEPQCSKFWIVHVAQLVVQSTSLILILLISWLAVEAKCFQIGR